MRSMFWGTEVFSFAFHEYFGILSKDFKLAVVIPLRMFRNVQNETTDLEITIPKIIFKATMIKWNN